MPDAAYTQTGVNVVNTSTADAVAAVLEAAHLSPTLRGVVAKTIVAKTSLHPFGKAL